MRNSVILSQIRGLKVSFVKLCKIGKIWLNVGFGRDVLKGNKVAGVRGGAGGECFAPSLAGQKQQRQRGQQVKGPPASGNLRPSSRFFRWVSDTPAKTALGSGSSLKDLPKDAVKPEIRQTARTPWAKN